MSEIIVAKNLIKSYNDTRAVDGLDLNIEEGEFFGFLGPNGAGKTTTIRMLTGIIRPDEGSIAIAGHSLDDRKSISGIIGVIPESRGFYDWMTANEYLIFFADLYGIQEKEERVQMLLSKVGLINKKNSRIGTYSRGMRQRLGLARSLINNPKILFLDEPTLGLDPRGQEDIQRLLRKLNSEGVTIFLSSHLLNEISDLCSRIGIINNGKMIEEGTIDEIREKTKMKDKTLTEIFLNLTEK
jgi:ABC-type multidrug transport system ATPase subunit